MESPNSSVTPLRLRMLEDMHMRQLAPKTQTAYLRAVRKLAAFTKKSPDTASAEDLRRFQLHMVDAGTSPISLNATITAPCVRLVVASKDFSFRSSDNNETEIFRSIY